MRAFSLGVLTLLALLAAGTARAETAAVLTPFTEEPVSDEVRGQTLDLVADWLRERGIEVVMPADAAPQLPPDLRHCRQERCALGYMQYIKQADYAVLTSVWGQSRGTGATGVSLTFLTRDGQRYDESWAITESLALSVDAALTHAYTSFLRGPGPWLTVRGTPAGAEVLVDGVGVGLLPCHTRIKPGEHEILVRHAGYASHRTAISVARKVDTHQELDITLKEGSAAAIAAAPTAGGAAATYGSDEQPGSLQQEPGKLAAQETSAPLQEPAVSDDPGRARPSSWNYVLGGTLAAAAIPLIAFPVAMFAMQDECYEEDEAGRCKRYTFGAQSGALLAAGVLALSGSVYFLVTAPILSGEGVSDRAALTGLTLGGIF